MITLKRKVSYTNFFHFRVKPEISEFCLGEFITEMRFSTNHINLTSEEFLKLEGNLFSTVIKLFYAFLWQVHTIFLTCFQLSFCLFTIYL